MKSGDLLAAADRNLTSMWRTLAQYVAGPPAVVDREHLLLLSAGAPVPLFNPAFPRGRGPGPEAIVEEVIEHYTALGMPCVLVFRDEVVPGLAEACARRGMVEHWRQPLMVLDPIPDTAPDLPAGLQIVPLTGENLKTYVRVVANGFGMPVTMAETIFGPWLTEFDGFTGLLGLLDDVPVATSAVYLAEGLAGVYNVATLAEYRGRGIGAAITWAAAEAGRRAGYRVSILQASQAGEPVYRRMGYVTPAHYRQFERR